MGNLKYQTGQAAIFLMLVLLIGLTAALALTQRSVTDVSTSTQTEQSSRAFSAAEAGLEKALQSEAQGSPLPGTQQINDLGNSAATEILLAYSLPRTAAQIGQPSSGGQAYEFPEAIKDHPAQFWLADPSYTPPRAMGPGTSGSTALTGFDLYYGNPDTTGNEIPAVEINIVYQVAGGNYANTRYYFDSDSTRANGFRNIGTGFTCTSVPAINTTKSASAISTPDRSFKCRITFAPSGGASTLPPGGSPILALVKILYSSSAQRIALKPLTSPAGQNLPPQSTIFTSRGNAGTSQKVLQLERLKFITPNFMDFAVFSAATVTK